MNAYLASIRAFLEANLACVTAKAGLKNAKGTAWSEANATFRRADDVRDVLFQTLMANLQVARDDGELVELLSQLDRPEFQTLRSIFSERGILSFLEVDPNSFAEILRSYRRANHAWTAAKLLHALRVSCHHAGEFNVVEFQTRMTEVPANANGRAWAKSVEVLNSVIAGHVAGQGRVIHLATNGLEAAGRMASDRIGDRLVTMIAGLRDNGKFELAVLNLGNEDLQATARDLVSRVPQTKLQLQPETETKSRWVA